MLNGKHRFVSDTARQEGDAKKNRSFVGRAFQHAMGIRNPYLYVA